MDTINEHTPALLPPHKHSLRYLLNSTAGLDDINDVHGHDRPRRHRYQHRLPVPSSAVDHASIPAYSTAAAGRRCAPPLNAPPTDRTDFDFDFDDDDNLQSSIAPANNNNRTNRSRSRKRNTRSRNNARTRASSNASNASHLSNAPAHALPSLPGKCDAANLHPVVARKQSRRPQTRAAAGTGAGLADENRAVTAVRSSKNAGLALKSRNSNVATTTLASLKGGKAGAAEKQLKSEKPSSAAPEAAKRRAALANSSNKVPQLAAGGRGGANRLVVAADPKQASKASDASSTTSSSVAGARRPAFPRRTSTRSSAADVKVKDEDTTMDGVSEVSRPIKSMRGAAASSRLSEVSNGVLGSRPTNIPRRSSTSTASTKNAGLKQSLRSTAATAAVVEQAPILQQAEPVKKSTKNAGLRLKREIQALEDDAEAGHNSSSSGRLGLSSTADNDGRAERSERRRSKRLRQSDPEAALAEEATAAAAIAVPSTSTSAVLDPTYSELEEAALAERSAAETVRRIIDTQDDVDDDKLDDSEIETDNEEEENMYEQAKDAGWEDLDIGDEDDPLMVSEYVIEIHNYMKELEVQSMPDPHYMDRQSEVNWKMRSILVDWLIEVHSKFRLLPETIFLAINIVDRLLSIRTVSLVKFQLVGIVSLQIAAKYEEVVCPSVSSFLYMTDGCYTEEEVLSAERYVLKQIDFDLSYPNPISFLRRVSKADGYDIQTRTVAKYFIEMSVVDRKFIKYPPSMVAAAGVWLARKILDRGDWDANLVHYSTYSQLELLPCAQLMLDYVLRRSQSPGEPVEHPHFTKKYSAKKFYRAAELCRVWAERRYLVRKSGSAANANTSVLSASAVQSLFTGLEGGGRLEEWEDEGEVLPEVDFD